MAYERAPEVIRQIEEALDMSQSLLRERALISSYKMPEYLQEETLVYLIREHQHRRDDKMVNFLAGVLRIRGDIFHA
jgi:hypothetical protein